MKLHRSGPINKLSPTQNTPAVQATRINDDLPNPPGFELVTLPYNLTVWPLQSQLQTKISNNAVQLVLVRLQLRRLKD